MEIYGTERERFGIIMDGKFFEKGYIIQNYHDSNLEVLERSVYLNNFEYTVAYPALIDDELDNALQHFRFLRKYNLV